MGSNPNLAALRAREMPAFVHGTSPAMRLVDSIMRELGQTDTRILISGERGVGKRAAAQEIHRMSPRGAAPFIGVDAASMGSDFFEQLRQGIDKPANGDPGHGTLYLAEIAYLRSDCQSSLLKLLDASESEPAGSYSIRVMCGTSRDLESEVRLGRLREDLYYRISGISLRIPPLRQRREDIPALMDFFLAKHSSDPGRALSAEAKQLLLSHTWPGNVRELEAAIRAIVEEGDVTFPEPRLRAWLLNPSTFAYGSQISLKQAARDASRQAEKDLILKVLTRTRWNRKRAAQELQISYKALLYKLKQARLEDYGTC